MNLNPGTWYLVLGAWMVLGSRGSDPSTKVEAPSTGGAQASAVVDEATLMVTRKGSPVGREAFRIVRSPGPGGQVYRAVASSAIGDAKLSATLNTDSLGVPLLYELRVYQKSEQQQYLQGRTRANRFSVLVQTKGGEAYREYVMKKGTVLLDDEVFHQLYFVVLSALASPDSTVDVILPRETAQQALKIEWKGVEVVVVGRQNLTGRRFALVDASSTVRSEIWIDALGRLLKVSVPAKSLVATRDDPPR
jgi:hypothetical protein